MRNIIILRSLTDTGHKNYGNAETYGCSESVYHTLQEVIIILYIKECHTEHTAVGGDKRKIYAECLIK